MFAAAALTAIAGLALAQASNVKRIDLQRNDLSIPGREAVQAIVEIAPGTTAAKHSHPGEEIIYVLEGTLVYEIDGRPPIALKAGDDKKIQNGANHSATKIGSGRGAELATYVVEKGKPLITPAR